MNMDLRSRSLQTSTPVSVSELMDEAIKSTPGATLFTNEAVDKYKSAVQRNELDRMSKFYQILLPRLNLRAICTLASAMVMTCFVAMLGACASVIIFVFGSIKYLLNTGVTGYAESLLEPASYFMICVMSFLVSYLALTCLDALTIRMNKSTWSVITPVAGTIPFRVANVMSVLRAKLAHLGEVSFQIHTLGSDPFVEMKLTDRGNGVTVSRFPIGWDGDYLLTQTGDRIHVTNVHA